MDTGTLVLATVVKILIILAVVVGLFAPGLVWAERRQSAMIQDRVGPHRAGIQLPAGLVDLMELLRAPLGLAALGCVGLCVLAVAGIVGEGTSLSAWSAGAAVALGAGYVVHDVVVKAKGNITLLGFLHPLADALKFIFKEDFVPPKADRFLHAMAPIITLVPTLAVFAVIPFADTVYLDHLAEVLPTVGAPGGEAIPMQIASLNVGILFIFAIAGTGVIGAAVGGYASDNKYSLMGGIRAASQMVSYEVALGLTLVPAFMIYGTLRLGEMATFQHEHLWGIAYPPMWFAFIFFFTAAVAETKRVPFDLPEGESELVGGYLTEYSGFKFGMFFMSEFIEVVGLSAICAVLFFGGWDVPFLNQSGWDLPGTWSWPIPGTGYALSDTVPMQHWAVIAIQVVVFFFVKVLGLIWFQLMIRWTLPRFRYDQVMSLCWKGLLPAALANILLTGVYVLVFMS
jgi:NADH-quinone oxidoreductase subunit H